MSYLAAVDEVPHLPAHFRPTALTSFVGELFNTMLKNRWQHFMIKHHSLSVCWLYLANAYLSVHHQFVTYCLGHYHAPQSFLDSITNTYCNLSATITSTEWSTASIPLKTGVYQGDPLSPIMFNTVMSTVTETLSRHTLSRSSVTTNVLSCCMQMMHAWL